MPGILPAAVFMVLIAPRSAKLVESHGPRFTLLTGYVFIFAGFLTMLLLGALLTAGYAAAATAAIGSSPQANQVTASVQSELTKSFDGATDIAKQYPQYSKQIIAAAKQSFIHSRHWAYASGLIAVVLGAILVYFLFLKEEEEKSLLARYRRTDSGRPDHQPTPAPARPETGHRAETT